MAFAAMENAGHAAADTLPTLSSSRMISPVDTNTTAPVSAPLTAASGVLPNGTAPLAQFMINSIAVATPSSLNMTVFSVYGPNTPPMKTRTPRNDKGKKRGPTKKTLEKMATAAAVAATISTAHGD